MITVKTCGGLGNQLFQYACAYAQAKRMNTEVCIEKTTYQLKKWPRYELDKLAINPDKVIDPIRRGDIINRAFFNKLRIRYQIGLLSRTYHEKNVVTHYNTEIEKISSDCYLYGFFQNEKYFAQYRKDLISQFKPNYDFPENLVEFIEKIGNCESVAIHVRRGDYVSIGCNIETDYYDYAINIVTEKIKNPIFFVFSDDIEFTKNYFLKYPEYTFVYVDNLENSEYKDLNEFFIMSSCKNQIIANSSFSWWAAWLNTNDAKIVIAPEIGMWSGDFYPSDWERIKINEGKNEL